MDERHVDTLGSASTGPISHENPAFVETGSDRAERKPSIRERAMDTKALLEDRYAHLAESAKTKSRDGVRRVRTEFDNRLRTNPMQVMAISAAAGFLAGVLVQMSVGRISHKRRDRKESARTDA